MDCLTEKLYLPQTRRNPNIALGLEVVHHHPLKPRLALLEQQGLVGSQSTVSLYVGPLVTSMQCHLLSKITFQNPSSQVLISIQPLDRRLIMSLMTQIRISRVHTQQALGTVTVVWM